MRASACITAHTSEIHSRWSSAPLAHRDTEMGKASWTATHYLAALAALGGQRPTLKLSYHCDRYSPFANYAGIVVYSSGGSFLWPASESRTGHGGRFAYVVIKNTGKWHDTDFKQQSQGRVYAHVGSNHSTTHAHSTMALAVLEQRACACLGSRSAVTTRCSETLSTARSLQVGRRREVLLCAAANC